MLHGRASLEMPESSVRRRSEGHHAPVTRIAGELASRPAGRARVSDRAVAGCARSQRALGAPIALPGAGIARSGGRGLGYVPCSMPAGDTPPAPCRTSRSRTRASARRRIEVRVAPASGARSPYPRHMRLCPAGMPEKIQHIFCMLLHEYEETVLTPDFHTFPVQCIGILPSRCDPI